MNVKKYGVRNFGRLCTKKKQTALELGIVKECIIKKIERTQ